MQAQAAWWESAKAFEEVDAQPGKGRRDLRWQAGPETDRVRARNNGRLLSPADSVF